jgi:hypothetical protein
MRWITNIKVWLRLVLRFTTMILLTLIDLPDIIGKDNVRD